MNGDAESFSVDGTYSVFHALCLRVRKEFPEEAVESGSTEVWSNAYGPAMTFFMRCCGKWPRFRRVSGGEAKDVLPSRCKGDRHGLSPFEQMTKRGDAFFALFLQYLFHHASEQAPNVLPPFFLREVPGQTDDDGVFVENSTGAGIPCLYDPVADVWGVGHRGAILLVFPSIPIAHFLSLLSRFSLWFFLRFPVHFDFFSPPVFSFPRTPWSFPCLRLSCSVEVQGGPVGYV